MADGKFLFFIDDDEAIIYLLTRIAKEIDSVSRVESAANGKIALECLQSWSQPGQELPNVMFVDINMPVMDGFEFLEQFREMRGMQSSLESIIPVVMLTSSANEADKLRAQELGIVDYFITKPTELDDLKRMIEDLVK